MTTNKTNPLPIADRVRQAVIASGKTYGEIAKTSGIHISSISRFMNSSSHPRSSTLDKIMGALR